MKSYDEFLKEVKRKLKSHLAAYGDVSDEEVNKLIHEEKHTVDGEYRHYKSGDKNKDLTPEALFNACAASAAYCLYMCY